MSHDTGKRTFLQLESVQGERLEVIFDILEADGVTQLPLDEYNFLGSVMEDFNDVPVVQFAFRENEDCGVVWEAYITGAQSGALSAKEYKYEIRMTHKSDGEPETLFYGTWELLKTRLG